MKIKFLGTGAAEDIPSFGCTCPRCRLAREEKGRNVRRRASLLIDAAPTNVSCSMHPQRSVYSSTRRRFLT